MVSDHPAHIAHDARAVAAEQRLEGFLAAFPHGGDQLIVRRLGGCCCCNSGFTRVFDLLEG